jgi:predicted DNA-binding protein
MRFADDRKHGHKRPHAEVSISFWIDREMSRQLNVFAHQTQRDRSSVIRDALIEHMERVKAQTNIALPQAPVPHAGSEE